MTSQLCTYTINRAYTINRGTKNIGQVIKLDGKIYIVGAILDNTLLIPPVYREPDTIGEALRTP